MSQTKQKQKTKEISAYKGIPKKAPILIGNQMLSMFKIIKPTHTVVFAGKENLFKYRNKILEENNTYTFFKDTNSIESIIKNSEVFSKRKNTNDDNSYSAEKNLVTNNSVKNLKRNSNEKLNKNSKIILRRQYSSNNSKENKILKNTNGLIENKNRIDKLKAFTQKDIINWLEDLNIIKPNSLQLEDIPSICSNGVLFADIINRLEGVSKSN